MNRIRLILVSLQILPMFLLGGCASMNPYDNEVYCRASYEGGPCRDVIDAYKEAVAEDNSPHRVESRAPIVRKEGGATAFQTVGAESAATGTIPSPQDSPLTPRQAYLNARETRIASLLQEPVTPVLLPPTLLRVLILPYTERDAGSDVLHMARYTYVKVEDSSFVLGDELAPYLPVPN